MEKIYSAIPYYYGATDESPNTLRLSIKMEGEVAVGMLRHAVRETMKRYPYFCVKAIKTETEFLLEENEEEVVVRSGMEPVTLGGPEANDHLIAFACHENMIYIDFFHGLTDGAGLSPLMATLLHYYCKERYDKDLDPAGIRLAGDEILPEEIEDPYPKGHFHAEKPSFRAGRKKVLKLADMGLCKTQTPSAYHVRITENELMKYARENDGSPAVVIALLISRAIDKLAPDSELPVVCGMTMNIRGILGKPLAHHSLVTQLFLEYKDKIKKMDTSRQMTCYRGMVMVQSQPENILFLISKNISLFERMESCPDVKSKQAMMKQVVSAGLGGDSFKVSYTGKLDMGAAEKYISGLYVDFDVKDMGIMVELFAVNGAVDVSFIQEWEEDVYYRAFLNELSAEGVKFEDMGARPVMVPGIAFH